MFEVELVFHGNLDYFLPRELRGNSVVRRALSEKTAVKDVIEACGVPHPEVDLITVPDPNNGLAQSVDFAWQVDAPMHVDVYPLSVGAPSIPHAQHLQTRHFSRFVADGHLGKLSRNLRLLGIDTAYERDADDHRLLEIMVNEGRALLTRDRRLLMHTIVQHGYSPRSQDPETQTLEVLDRFSLRGDTANFFPYTRCLRCNSRLERVAKSEVLESLANEPLTLRYYEEFHRCTGCGKIYWPGTHFKKLTATVAKLGDT